MIELVNLMLISIALAWCADHVIVRPADRDVPRRLVLCSVLIVLLLAGFAGLRTRCNDTFAYRHAYELINETSWEAADKQIGANPLFNWVNYQLKMQGVSTQNFLMFWAFLTVGGYILFLHRFSAQYPETIFLLMTTGCYTFAFAGIKQAAAIALAVVGVVFFFRRNWVVYILCVAVAALIHPYALMYFAVPLMQFTPWTKSTWILLTAALLCGFFLRPLIGTVINITTLLGEEYTADEFTGEGVNLFRVLVCNVPLVLSFIYRRTLFADSTKAENLMMNLSMLNGAIMFVGLFGTANYFARLANYFLIFQSLSLPWMLKKIGGRDGRWLTGAMILGYTAYFAYANLINQPFDREFAKLTVSEYLAQWRG